MLKRLPIKVKLTLITAVTSILALLACSAGFLYYDLATFKIKMSSDLRTEADVIGTNCAAALAFNDQKAVEEVLRSLKPKEQIEAAAVYTPDGKLFAQFTRGSDPVAVPTSVGTEGAHFSGDKLIVVKGIHSDNDTVGKLYIRSGMGEWTARRDSYTAIIGSLMILCACIALAVGARLQRVISVPIVDLASAMRAVAHDEEYGRRVEKTTDDEVGELVDGFNSMLAEIQERDRELHLANEDLEHRVRQRTAELEREVSERKAAQEELTASRQSLEDFFENATVGLHWLGPDGTILRANRAELDMLGYTADEYVGRNVSEFHTDQEVISDILRRLANRETLTSYEARMRCKDGRIKHVSIESNVLWDGDTFVHTRCFTRDLTEQKDAERARTARERAERANHAKSEFLSRMSHELRTPMNAIMGFGQLLAMDDLTADQRDSVERLMAAGKHLLKLINEVLDISRIEAGKLAISNEPVAIADVVHEVLSFLHPLAEQRRVAVLCHIPEDDETHAVADRQRLRQVLLNLVSNAIKYNVEFGEVRIDGDLAGDEIRLTVSDTGPGIPAEKAEMIFTPFERLGAEQSSVEGTGLGLALSKSLVEAMGGTIGLLPTEQGAAFFIGLPRAESPLTLLSRRDSAAKVAQHLSIPNQGAVLLVEDNLSNVRLMEKILARDGEIELLLAMTGDAAIETAKRRLPDLVLLDLNLPDVHGEEVILQLRACKETADIPVVVVSADASQSQIDRLLQLGAVDYLTKPVEVDTLLRVVNNCLREKVKRSA